MNKPAGIMCVDFETTGLDPDTDRIWEATMIIVDQLTATPPTAITVQVRGFILADLHPAAAAVNHFAERYNPDETVTRAKLARMLVSYGAGRHWMGANPAFDLSFARTLLHSRMMPPTWHHRPIDVESMVMGHLGLPHPMGLAASADALGIRYEQDSLHSSAGDADLAFRIWDHIVNGVDYTRRFAE